MASFHWIANRRITVKGDVIREEGDHVPEADEWKDPELWEKAGHVRKKDGPAPGHAEDTRTAAQRQAARDEAEAAKALEIKAAGLLEVEKLNNPPSRRERSASLEREAPRPQLPEASDDGAPPFETSEDHGADAHLESDDGANAEPPGKKHSESALRKMLKSELAKLCAGFGIKLQNPIKSDLVGAVLAAQEG